MRYGKFVFLVMLLFSIPNAVSANMVWPALYISKGINSWYIIVAGLIIEYFFIKFFAKQEWVVSGFVSVCMNLVSALLGVVLIPLFGLLAEFAMLPLDEAFDIYTFHRSHWLASYIVTVFVNALIEGCAMKIIFKIEFKKNFWWLLLANFITVLICISVLGFEMPLIDI